MISFKQIRYALAIQKHLHFRNAAEECAVSQSALSTALSEMERIIGFTVFERDNKKVLVTPIGEQFLSKAKAIQLQVDDLMALTQVRDAVLSYPMSVGIIPTICPYILPKVLPALSEEYPSFQFNVVEEQSAPLLDMVRDGEIDAAILALPYKVDGLLSFEFWAEDLYWISHTELANGSSEVITAKELEDKRLMLLKDGHCLKDQALSACKIGSDKAQSLSATSLSTLIQLVIGKIGTTLIPEMALAQLVEANPSLVAKRLSEPGPHRRIAFVVRPNYPSLHNIEALMTLFKGQLGKLV
ncbi:hydrogen peroxide-inducible genes activator [Arenicella xantha]|uniref:LysR family transcriptional regulator n=1 Tax=Arenicella xantha TaxID=644221 RepID=A0A395JP20_9GAMM|nr:hydrogen peroxide-inducible genes activator [Arenicella xantha]RBP53349.1 LysR family transcriptional regulator [Arenicella xantha]